MESLLKPDPGIILWTLIIFGLLVVVLGKFAWKPILKMVREREERIRESVEKAAAAKTEAERVLQEQKALSQKNREDAADLLRHARAEADRATQEILDRARREADGQVERARQQIEEERARAVDSVRREAVELAIAAASHLLQRSLDSSTHRALVETYIAELPKNLPKH